MKLPLHESREVNAKIELDITSEVAKLNIDETVQDGLTSRTSKIF